MKWMLVAAAAAVIGAAPAHADELSFLTDVKAGGFGSDINNGALIGAARHMCDLMGAGDAPEQVAEDFFERSQVQSLDMARRFVGIARKDLCNG